MSDRWRLFVAVPVGEGLRAALASAVDAWRERPDLEGLRWTDPTTWHITLLFLGTTESATATSVVQRLEEVARRHEPMRLTTGGLGGFPSAGRARVAWYGVADPDRSLHRLTNDVRAVLAPEDGARFRAHITLGRARSEPVDLRPWAGSTDAPAGELAVDEMRLMRSHLGRGPARYETVAAIPIGVPAHV